MGEKPKPLDLEELVEKLADMIFDFYGHGRGEIKAILKKEIKQRIKEACEFYLRYKDEPNLLKKEFPEQLKADKKKFGAEDILDNFLTVINDKVTSFDGFGIETYKRKYNEWLFKLAFRGVLEEGERK